MNPVTVTDPLIEAQARAVERDRIPRAIPLEGVEVRRNDDGGFSFRGTAAVFDKRSEDLGGFVEVIKRGAFKDVLEDDVRLLFNHDPNFVMARTASGTLSLEEKPKGLVAEADIGDYSYANDIRLMLEREDVSQMSFAFRIDPMDESAQEWEELGDGTLLRTIKRFSELFDVSVVTYPAYPQTDAGVRAMAKLHRGEALAEDEREALLSRLGPNSTDTPPEERDDRADGSTEPVAQAEGDESQVVEEPVPTGGISSRSARVRMRAIEARL